MGYSLREEPMVKFLLPLVSLLALLVTPAVTAQNFPNRPVRVLVGLGPGGGSDTVARIMTTDRKSVV